MSVNSVQNAPVQPVQNNNTKNKAKSEKPQMSTGKKVAIVSAAVASASLAAGIAYGIHTGKLNKLKDKLASKFKKAANVSTEAKKAVDISAEIKKPPYFNGETISMDEFKKLKADKTISTGDWISGNLLATKELDCKVEAFAKNGNKTVLTYKNGMLQEAITTNPAGDFVSKKTYGKTMVGGDGTFKYANTVFEKADGTSKIHTVGNIEGNEYVYFNAIDGKVSDKMYIQHGLTPITTTSPELQKYTQEYFDKYDASKLM